MRLLRSMMLCLLCAAVVMPALAQDYGTGASIDIPYVAPGTITIDGSDDEAAWQDAKVLTMSNGDFVWDGGYLDGYGAEPDIEVVARLLHTDGQLLVHMTFEHYDELYWREGGFGGNSLLVGIDPLHEAGVSDRLYTEWDGFAENNPNEGPIVFFIDGPQGATLAWGGAGVDPVAEGFVEAQTFVDDATFTWGVEIAINSSAITTGNQIGFNIGGVTALEELIYNEQGEGDYAWFSWQTCDEEEVPSEPFTWCGPGGTMLQNTWGYGTANLVTATAIEQIAAEIPSGFHLDQNYPNPFNPATRIEFGLQQMAHVGLSVYNTLGQRVATLVDGVQQPGAYSVSFDASDLPSGIYLYRLEVNGRTVSARKMVLLR